MILSPGHGRSRQFYADDRDCQAGAKIHLICNFVMKQWQDCEYSQALPDEIAIMARKSPKFRTAKHKRLIGRGLKFSRKKEAGLCPRLGKML